MCEFCQNHERGDTLYEPSDWDGGIGFDYIRDIKYCPLCGRKLDSEDEPNCSEIPNNSTISKMEQVDWKDQMWTEAVEDEPQTTDYCDVCNHKGCDNCIADANNPYCLPSGYEPTNQTETQNSNLTFEKDECAKEYEELGLKELKELINADRKTENCSEKPNNCEHITEDGVTCAKYPACDDCPDNPLNKVKGSERLVKGLEQDPLHDDCFDCDKFFTCDNKGDDYKTDCAWKKGE